VRGLQCARHLLAARGDANFEGESMGVSALLCPVLSGRLCRNVVFVRANVKVVGRKINDLQGSPFLFSVMCDRAVMPHGGTTKHEKGLALSPSQSIECSPVGWLRGRVGLVL